MLMIQLFNKKYINYQNQDIKANRKVKDDYIKIEEVKMLLNKYNHQCIYCWKALSSDFTLDRINNFKSHTFSNCVIACEHCNKARSNGNFNEFYEKKCLERYSKEKPQIFLINEANKKIFYKLKHNIVGGPSLVFADIMRPTKHIFKDMNTIEASNEFKLLPKGKLVKDIIGFDANALYLWCLAQVMPCGELKMENALNKNVDILTNEILNDQLFGFVECDIEVPKALYNHFSEMCPIFANKDVENKESNIGKYMFNIITNENKNKINKKERKLVGLLSVKKILLYTPLLQWYLQHGLKMTKVYNIVNAERGKPFAEFTEIVSNARRTGDVDKSLEFFADTMKLIGNSAFGSTGMDKSKHVKVKMVRENVALKLRNSFLFKKDVEYKDFIESTSFKRKIKQNMPLQVASAVYQLAKLRILEFYYDCLDKYVSREDFQLIQMDTDSMYMAITDENFDNLIKPEMKKEYEADKNNWFPSKSEEFCQEIEMNGTKYQINKKQYDKRTPGLFKIEWEGSAMIALTSKMYFGAGIGGKNKVSMKGIQVG